MSKVFGHYFEKLSEDSGYDYDFLVDVYNECMNDNGVVDLGYFTGVSMEHDW